MQVLFKRILTLLFALCLLLGLSFQLSPKASAADNVIQKILTTVTPTPVALMDPASITAATSTPGLSITSAGWFDASGKAVKGAFNPETYKIEIHVKADNGYTIASDVAAYLNNSAVNITVENSGQTATIVREYTAAIWAPTIIKNPSAETVKEGGWASFAATANYARDYEWFLEGPDGRQAVSVSDINLTYPEMSATGNGSTKMNLYHIPYELNGWKVVCNFIGAGTNNSVKSQGALLTVIPTTSRPVETPAAEPEKTAGADAATADTDTADAAAGDVPAEETAVENGSDATPVEIPASAPETVYSDSWSSDARGHWHDSISQGDDSRAEEALHNFVWYEGEDGTQTGVCDVCGFTITKRPAAAAAGTDTGSAGSGSGDSSGSVPDPTRDSGVKPSAAMILLMALVPVDAALIGTYAVRSVRKSSKNKAV